MLFNKMPFSGKDKDDLIKHIIKKDVKFPDRTETPPITKTVKDLLLKMLTKDPNERIVMIDCLDHKWFKMTDEEIEEEQKEITIDL